VLLSRPTRLIVGAVRKGARGSIQANQAIVVVPRGAWLGSPLIFAVGAFWFKFSSPGHGVLRPSGGSGAVTEEVRLHQIPKPMRPDAAPPCTPLWSKSPGLSAAVPR